MEVENGEQDSDAFDETKYWDIVKEKPEAFSTWTSLITFVEKKHAVDVEKICQLYDSFLHEFPLCYGYWKKYADHMINFNLTDKAAKVYEEATKWLAYSVDHWLNYCGFAVRWFDEAEDIRRLFERALGFVGKDYLNHSLWNMYIEFEFSQKQWGCLAHIYFRAFKFPNKQLDKFFQSFEELSASWRAELQSDGDVQKVDGSVFVSEGSEINCDRGNGAAAIDNLSSQKTHLAESMALKKYVSAGEQIYHKSKCLDVTIQQFETNIRRPYFHVKPLDNSQLENWHLYLDFVEAQADFDWIVKLYERCLIACANYMEFWVRYVQCMEAKGGREIAKLALQRSVQVFLKRMPSMHLFAARFMEKIRDMSGARTELLDNDSDCSYAYVENIIHRANMERRLGNFEEALAVYERALESECPRQSFNTVSVLYTQYSQLKLKVSGIDAARDVLLKGIQQLPPCKFLLEALINFETIHGGTKHMAALEAIIQKALSSDLYASDALSANDREHISCLFLECVDSCGDIHQVIRAWDAHVKLFPYLFRPNCSKRNALALTGIVGFKCSAELERQEPLGPTCNSVLLNDPPQHFIQEIAFSKKKNSNGAEVCQSHDETKPKIGPGVKYHSSPDKLVHGVESANGSKLELETQQTSDTHQESMEPSQPVSLTAKPMSEPQGLEKMQPDSDLGNRRLQIALQSPPLETLSINPRQNEAQPSPEKSSQEEKTLPVISRQNEKSIKRRDGHTHSCRYDQAGNPVESSIRKQVLESDAPQSVHDPSLQGAEVSNVRSRTMSMQDHHIVSTNSASWDNHNHDVIKWQQMQHSTQTFAGPGYYSQQQQWSQVPYLPVSEYPQAYPYQGYAFPPQHQYPVPPHAYPDNAQGWHTANTEYCMGVVPQDQQSNAEGQLSQCNTLESGEYDATQTQKESSWHLQQQQQTMYQQQWQLYQYGWNDGTCQQTVYAQYGVNTPYQQEYGGQAMVTPIAGTAHPSYGAQKVVESPSQTEALPRPEDEQQHRDT